MKQSRLYVGQKITVKQLPDGERFKSMVQDLDDKTVSITLPVRKGEYLLLHNQDSVQVEFPLQDAIYSFTCEVSGRRKVNQVSLVVIPRPTVFSRRQRRQFVRLPVIMPLHIYLDNTLDRNKKPSASVPGKVVDISGGGLQFTCNIPLQAKSSLNLLLPLDDEPKNPPLQLRGVVSWVDEDEQNNSIRVGLSFTDISEADRERIISYIFRKMRNRIPTV